MTPRFRLLVAISVLMALSTALVACGGSSSSSGENPNTVLDQTFSSSNPKVKSADLDLKLGVNVSGSGSHSGNINAELSGPFESQGSGNIPKLDISAKASGSSGGKSLNFDAGLISTGTAAYVSYKGANYVVPATVLSQYKTLLQQSTQQTGKNQTSGTQLLQRLGINDPKSLLTNLKSDGTADVEGTSTNHISGDLDIGKTIDALKSALTAASALNSLGGSTKLPSPSQLDQIQSAIKTAHFDLYSGQSDHILRRITITLSIVPPSSAASGVSKIDVTFDLTLGKVNEPQTITAPSGAKPLSALLAQLGVNSSSLGALGSLGGAGSAVPTTPSAPAPSGTSSAKAQKYIQCISQAKSAADIQKCQSLTQ